MESLFVLKDPEGKAETKLLLTEVLKTPFGEVDLSRQKVVTQVCGRKKQQHPGRGDFSAKVLMSHNQSGRAEQEG